MAWTVTRYPTVFGNKKVVGLKLTPDSAEANVQTGLSVIEWYSVGHLASMNSAVPDIRPNVNSTGTAAMGTLGCSGFTSGDDCYVTVFGR